ncbi:MAG: ASCH domain-containing protein [Pseudomonadota bacterium]
MAARDSLDALRKRYPAAPSFTFGDSRHLCDALLALVRQGTKRATCGALRDYIADGDPLPEPGRADIVLDWDGNPALVIETTDMTIRQFRDVTEEFALAEGEDETLAGWRAGHRAYFERNGGWSDDMDLVCMRFRLIEDFGSD